MISSSFKNTGEKEVVYIRTPEGVSSGNGAEHSWIVRTQGMVLGRANR